MTYVTGVILALAGAIASNLGMNLQKLSKSQGQQRVGHSHKHHLYWCGTFCIALTQVLDFVALGLVSQSVVGALNGAGIASNLIWCNLFFGTTPHANQVYGLLVVCLGNLVVVLTSDATLHEYDIVMLEHLFHQPSFIIYIFIMTNLNVVGFLTRNVSHGHSTGRLRAPLLSGIWSGQTFLCCKMLSELVARSLASSEPNPFHHPLPYILIILLGCSLWIQQCFYNHILAFGDHDLLPIFSCTFIATCILASFCVFQEYSFISWRESLCLWTGLCLILVGIAIFQQHIDVITTHANIRATETAAHTDDSMFSTIELANMSATSHVTNGEITNHNVSSSLNQSEELALVG